jgi:hypothetical protein
VATCKDILNQRALHMIPTDKDGGFALVPHSLLRHATQKILQSGDYAFGQPQVQQLNMCYRNLAKSWSTFFEVPGLCKAICRSLGLKGAAHTTALTLNVKSHKSPVEFRNIHGAHRLAFAGLSSFVADVVQRRIVTYAHVLKNTRHFVDLLKGITPHKQQRFARFDV